MRVVGDGGAQAGVELGLRVEHVLDDAGHEAAANKADEVARVEEATARAQLPERVGDGGEVEADVGFRGDEFDVEGDDLLLQEEQVLDQEEGGVGGRGARGDEGGGGDEGDGGAVHDAVGEVVEDGGLGCG